MRHIALRLTTLGLLVLCLACTGDTVTPTSPELAGLGTLTTEAKGGNKPPKDNGGQFLPPVTSSAPASSRATAMGPIATPRAASTRSSTLTVRTNSTRPREVER